MNYERIDKAIDYFALAVIAGIALIFLYHSYKFISEHFEYAREETRPYKVIEGTWRSVDDTPENIILKEPKSDSD